MSSNIWCTPWLTDFTPLHHLRRVRRYRHRILPRLHRGHLEAADLCCLRAAWELRQRAEPWHHPAPPAGSQMKNCTLLWREAHFEVKMYKAHHSRTTFGSWDVKKKCTQLWREENIQVKMCKAQRSRTTFGSWDVKKSARRCGTKHVQGKMCKHHMLGQLWTFRCRFAGQAQGIVHLVTVSKTWGFSSISKNDGRRVTCEEDLERSIFRGRGNNTRDMLIRDVRRSGRWFPERGCVLEHQIFSFGKMILCDRCSTPYDPGLAFSRQAQYFRHMNWKKRKTHWLEAVSTALNFPFLKEVSQNCFVFDVVNFENWGSLAELLRFWRCQVRKLRKSRRTASFLTLSSSRIEEVSQNSFVMLRFQTCR